MEFRSGGGGQEEETGMPVPPGFTSNPIRLSAFSKPTLPPTSSLVFSPRGLPARNETFFEPKPAANVVNHSLSSPDPPSAPISSPSATPPAASAASAAAGGSSVLRVAPPRTSSAAKTSAAATPSTAAKYRECLRNHAASVGGHVVDGCGEFMPGGDAGTPDAVKCAACGCHRSFHRKESDGERAHGSSPFLFGDGTPPSSRGNGSSGGRVPLLLPPHPHHNQKPLGFPPTSPPTAGIAFGANNGGGGGGTPTESSSEELNAGGAAGSSQRAAEGARKKRFRTKFTAEQKGKMLEFAERVGWRIHRQDEAAVEQFCAEVGVRRQVLKVWMHNNKHTLRKLQPPPAPPPPPPS